MVEVKINATNQPYPCSEDFKPKLESIQAFLMVSRHVKVIKGERFPLSSRDQLKRVVLISDSQPWEPVLSESRYLIM